MQDNNLHLCSAKIRAQKKGEKVFVKCYLFEMAVLSLSSTSPEEQEEQRSWRLAGVISRGGAAT